MLDQSYNLNCCFLVLCIFQIYIYSKKLFLQILSSSVIIWNFAPVVNVVSSPGTGRLASDSRATSRVLDISDILDHDKSSSILKLIKGKFRDLQKLRKYFNGTRTSASNLLLSAAAFPVIFYLTLKRLTCFIFIDPKLPAASFSFASSFTSFLW